MPTSYSKGRCKKKYIWKELILMFKFIKLGVKEVNVFPTPHLPCVTLHMWMVGRF